MSEYIIYSTSSVMTDNTFTEYDYYDYDYYQAMNVWDEGVEWYHLS